MASGSAMMRSPWGTRRLVLARQSMTVASKGHSVIGRTLFPGDPRRLAPS